MADIYRVIDEKLQEPPLVVCGHLTKGACADCIRRAFDKADAKAQKDAEERAEQTIREYKETLPTSQELEAHETMRVSQAKIAERKAIAADLQEWMDDEETMRRKLTQVEHALQKLERGESLSLQQGKAKE